MKSVVAASALALVISLLGTPHYIRFLCRRGYGQFILYDGPDTHKTKRGTPTMGGAVMILATLIGYFGAHVITMTPVSPSVLLVLGLITGLGIRGLAGRRTARLGLQRPLVCARPRSCWVWLFVGSAFAIASVSITDEHGNRLGSTAISFVRDISWLDLFALGPILGLFLVVVWVNLIVAGASNGVNLTDGLDGLATGAATMVFGAYVLIGIWQDNQNCYSSVRSLELAGQCYPTPFPYDLAVCAAALAGATFGFLWWNASPAKIFMGDTGSLALGGALAGLAMTTRTELLMASSLGGLFVIDVLSVIIQVGYFKLSGGKRVFRMAPLQHHFELKGWNEVTVIVPVLDHRRGVHGARARHVLRGVDRGDLVSIPPEDSAPSLTYEPRPGLTCREADWGGAAGRGGGLGISGFAAADALLERGAHVTVVDAATDGRASWPTAPRSCGCWTGTCGSARSTCAAFPTRSPAPAGSGRSSSW